MRFSLYLVTYLCLIATLFNDGFSKMFFSMPFIFFLLADSILSKSYRTFTLNTISIVVLLVLAFIRFSNPFIYPILSKELVTKKDYKLTHSPCNTQTLVSVDYLKTYFKSEDHLERYKAMRLYKEYFLKKGTLILPKEVMISGHPDILSIKYKLQININDSKLQDKIMHYISSHNEDIMLEINNQFPKNMQDKYIYSDPISIPNSTDKIYAASWYFDNFSKQDNKKDIESIIEKYFGWIVMIFNPMYIWIYLIIFAWQRYYIKKRYKTTFL